MSNFNIGLSADNKTVYVTRGGDALPGGATNVLTDFVHDDTADVVDANPENHVLFHHVQEALYHAGILDMQSVSIVVSGALAAEYLSAAAVTVADPGTVPIVIKYQPANVNAANADFNFVSANPAVATVSAAGVVTGVANGSTTVTATEKGGTKSVVVAVTIT
ncbi:Ig-like domain-containing protein [Mesorhizobium sp. M4B.F.Ca.ET.058.02.1.1]|uniref:Ig-like domain-containing protein n=1 Tax=Mesorhizobium sp. M4B.F.Ca.ET.058.02.1.1 TaxID=2493675 RepID=UPI000F74E5CB|nr:Ig-like domain-containing protein [Mesorhizobium sp. M4B.F.Ca.ET.058.02.1.1]AZO48084.1 hypothetical protein EJ073_09835 [Mesorhizobium sp. M4B.F.Ca.ET.058.02.1.1]